MAEVGPLVSSSFEWRQSVVGRILVSPAVAAVADHFFSSQDVAPAGALMPDYEAVGSALGLSGTRVVRVRQVHGRQVLVIRQTHAPAEPSDADVIVSTTPDFAVSVRVADCVPILIADRQGRAVAAVHAGWRGTAAGAAVAAVEALAAEGISPTDLVAAIGPSIGPCCYQVDGAVLETFGAGRHGAEEWFTPDGAGRWRLDLWRANRDQLRRRGVLGSNIVSAESCTAHNPQLWYSHRRQGEAAGRMVAAIRLRTPSRRPG